MTQTSQLAAISQQDCMTLAHFGSLYLWLTPMIYTKV